MTYVRVKYLHSILPKNSGRNNTGKVSVRHQGGREKRFYRKIDWKRDKHGVTARVLAIEYDPNRTADVALLQYTDGEKRYILAPLGLKVGQNVNSGANADIRTGNSLPLRAMPVGTIIHNLEIFPGRGAQMIRSAGSFATIIAVDDTIAHIKLSSGEIRKFKSDSYATVGQLGNENWKNEPIGKAGRARHMGIRPSVRGVAMNPRSHPHGGGEGRSGVGLKSPKSRWGKRTMGKRTRKRTKYSDAFIISRRRGKK